MAELIFDEDIPTHNTLWGEEIVTTKQCRTCKNHYPDNQTYFADGGRSKQCRKCEQDEVMARYREKQAYIEEHKRLIHVNDVVSLITDLWSFIIEMLQLNHLNSLRVHTGLMPRLMQRLRSVRYCVLTVTKHITTTKGQVVKDQKNISGMRSTLRA